MKSIGKLFLMFAVSVFSERLICSIWRLNAQESKTIPPLDAGIVDEIALSGCWDERELLYSDNETIAAGRWHDGDTNVLTLRKM
ncbi:hypothetical protein [Halobacillus massiliensis]|uniref:hypothetical protein n=1 Tax=Halobacillus massiliensis TaxID=1926286 RepID=UPI0009E3C41D|nr:hypothetical protein [Halobacillus massiliensis]